jgi:hypothetical protein
LFSVRAADKYRLINALRKYSETITAWPFGDSVHLTLINDRVDDSLYALLEKEGVSSPVIEECVPGIEDRFLELMEKGAIA